MLPFHIITLGTLPLGPEMTPFVISEERHRKMYADHIIFDQHMIKTILGKYEKHKKNKWWGEKVRGIMK